MNKTLKLLLIASAFLIPGVLLLFAGSIMADVLAGMIFGVGLCVVWRVRFPRKGAGRPQPVTARFSPHPTQSLQAVDNPLLDRADNAIAEEAATLQQAAALGLEFRRRKRADIETTVDQMLERFLEVISAKLPFCTIAIFFPTAGEDFLMRRSRSNSNFINRAATITPRRGILGTILAEGLRRHYEPNFENPTSTLYYYDEKHAFTPEESIRSVMLTPVDTAGSAIVLVDSTRKDAYTEADREFLENTAKLMGMAIYHTYMSSENSINYQRLTAMSSLEQDFWIDLEFDAVMDKMRNVIPHVIPCDRLTISLKNEKNKMQATVVRVHGEASEGFLGLRFQLGSDGPQSIASPAYEHDFSGFARNFLEDRYQIRYAENEPMGGDFASFAAIQFGLGTQIKGVILLESEKKDAFVSPQCINMVSLIGNSAAKALEKIFMIKKVEEMAIHDELTGLYNRRRVLELLSTKIKACKRFNHPLTFVMGDIDFFKKVNDTYGHEGGDIALKGVAARLNSSIRLDIDVAGRFGGEEFVLILDKMGHREAEEKVDKIRTVIQEASFTATDGKEIKSTMSFGIASYPHHSNDIDDLMRKADSALYKAKHNGRNRVEVFGE